MQVAEPGRVAAIEALTPAGQQCLQETDRAWQTIQDDAC
jgi:hypothetical protein